VIVVIDSFFKMAHFVVYDKANEASHVADLYFKEIIRPYRV